MLRTVLVGLLVVTAVGCSSKSESAKTAPASGGGKVVEVTGHVTAQRGDVVRELKVGDSVAGDDKIDTGADGSIKIELDHNHVQFTFGPGTQKLVSASIAWKADVKAENAKAAEVDTSAAGRAAERSNADTVATARAPEAAKAEPAAAAPDTEAARDDMPAPPPPPPPPSVQPAPGGGAGAGAGAGAVTGGKLAKPERAKKAAPPADQGSMDDALADKKVDESFKGSIGRAAPLAAAMPQVEASTTLDVQSKAEVQKCLAKGMHVELKIDVDANGKAKVAFVSKRKVSDSVKKCITDAIGKASFPKSTASFRIVLDQN